VGTGRPIDLDEDILLQLPTQAESACNRVLEVTIVRQFDVVIEKDSAGYFVASVPALPGCHTQAKSLDELMERIREAIELCLEVRDEPTEPLDFVGVQRITVAA
jgi:predicted RNase H-like HicB family nuclease